MCEFCTAHGEGQKWYLQVKNYAEELLHEALSCTQKEMLNASARLEWNRPLCETFVVPRSHRRAPASVVGSFTKATAWKTHRWHAGLTMRRGGT